MRRPLTPPEFRTWTMSDGYVVHGRVWRPVASKPERAILYLHGIQSHGGWFEWSASLLAGGGNAVILPDRRGSGLNNPARGDTPGFDRWLDDICELSDWTEGEFGVSKIDMVGVSWGGKPALAAALRRGTRTPRLLLVAPGFFPAVGVGLATQARIGLSLVAQPERRFPIPLDDPALFTQSPEGQSFIENDPLKLTHATARFLYASAKLDRQLRRARSGVLDADVTLFLAGRDRIVRNAPTIDRLADLASIPITATTFETAAHTLEFESDPDAFGDAVSAWAAGR